MTERLADTKATAVKGRYLRIVDVDAIETFYRSMDAKMRRSRFGAGVSDSSIARYCRSIDWRSVTVLGLERATELQAVVELHPLRSDRGMAEIAIACRSSALDAQTLASLLQLASFVAAAAGVRTLVFAMDEAGFGMPSGLHAMGAVSVRCDHAYVDVTHYATSEDIAALY